MRIVAVGMRDLNVLEEATADLVCRLAEHEAEPKSKMADVEELTLHLDFISNGPNVAERFKLSFVGEGVREKFKALADSKSFEVPSGISKKDLGDFFTHRISQILFCHGWIWGRRRPDGYGFLSNYRRAGV